MPDLFVLRPAAVVVSAKIGLRLLRELTALDVSYNRLKKWPPQMEECKNLRDLRLDHNKLQEVGGGRSRNRRDGRGEKHKNEIITTYPMREAVQSPISVKKSSEFLTKRRLSKRERTLVL